VCVYKGKIAVEDASGARFDIHEFMCRRFLKRATVFQLDTGEDVRRIDNDTFQLTATGETLLRV
jgi:hypothetical protein